MADAFVAGLASGLVLKLVSLATDEVIQAWNLDEDLVTLRERLESFDALISDVDAKKLTTYAVQNWFNKLESVAHVAHKVKSIHASFDKLFKLAGDIGLQPVAHLSSILQPREIRTTLPLEDESLIVGREKDISYLVQTVCKKHEQGLQVIAVIGMGGQGKTTLAKMVYNTDSVVGMFPKRMWVTVSDDFDFMKILNQMVVSLTSTPSELENTEGLIIKLQKKLKGEKFLLVLDDVWNEKPDEWDNLKNSLLGVGSARGSNVLVTTRKKEVIDAMHDSVFVSYPVEKLSEEDSWTLFRKRAFSHGGVPETEAFASLGRRMVERCGGLPLAIKTLGGLLHSKKSEQEWLLMENSEIWKSKGVLSSLRLSYDNLPYSSLKRCFAYCSNMPKDSVINNSEMVQIWMALGFLLPPKDSNALMEDIGNEYFDILLWNSLLQDVKRDKYDNITSCKMHDLVHDLALDLSKHHSVTVRTGHELNHVSNVIYVRLDKGVSDIKPKILKRNTEKVQTLYARACILGDVLPYLKHLTVLILNTYEVNIELPSSLRKMKYLKHLDISCSHYKLPSYVTGFYNLQTLRVRKLKELPRLFCNLIMLRHLFVKEATSSRRCMFIGIERLIFLQTMPHFVVSRDQNCLIGQLGMLKDLRGKLELYGLDDIENMKEASQASLFTKSNIDLLKLVWSNSKDEVEETNDEDVIEGLKPHTSLKELTIDYFKGRKFPQWIRMLTNLVKITLRNCKRCERLPALGHFPNLRQMEINGMNNVKVIGSHSYGGLGNGELSDIAAVKTVTTMYPSLTKLLLLDLPNLEKWLEPFTGGEDQSSVLVFPKLEELCIQNCSKLKSIPSSYLPSLKDFKIIDLDNSILLQSMSRKVSSLTDLRIENIGNGGGGSFSSYSLYMDSILDKLLKNNLMSLKSLKLWACQGLTRLTLGAALENIVVVNCPDLKSTTLVKGSGALECLRIDQCRSLSNCVFVQSLSSTLVRLSLGPFSEELDEFLWPFSSSFPNLIFLLLIGWEKVKLILPELQPDDHLFSTFPALTHLEIIDFPRVKFFPDSLAKLPSLKELYLQNCKNLESLPTFNESYSLKCLKIADCPILKEKYKDGTLSGSFKIQHISSTQR
ncbi:Disease resistance protein RGA1 [Heracleum sosnowskyi]|uniref:Disease resistance protein RGA1 n=1 Tax=Heracleum sosnowskyi TaxID=360622 RepID=A0AAD8HF07_9APIA|nr:Disease resistance protein RGA1 [Heracleum sosnowskyi]